MPDKKLPAVPETILKKRKRAAEARALRAKEALKTKIAKKAKKVAVFKRAEKYCKEYRLQELDQLRLKREAKKEGNFYVPSEPKLAFVIRIRGINQVAPKVRKVLQLFRLRQINNGVFIKLNKATVNMLRICGKWPNIWLSALNMIGTSLDYCAANTSIGLSLASYAGVALN